MTEFFLAGVDPEPLALILQIFAVLVGASVGSFLNVCIYRIPIEGLGVSSPSGSFCPGCKKPLRWFENIPVLAWLGLKGRCSGCKMRISFRYPFVEGLTALFFLWAMLRIGGEPFFADPLGESGAMLLGSWIWISLVIVVCGIDFDHRIIPDGLSVSTTALMLLLAPWNSLLPGTATIDTSQGLLWGAALIGGAIFGIVFQRFVPSWSGQRRTLSESYLAYVVGVLASYFAAGFIFGSLDLNELLAYRSVESLLGAAAGAGLIWGIGLIGSWIFRKPAMGFGDVKWMGMLGATIGVLPVVISFFLACILGSMIGVYLRIKKGQAYIPFGPFLSGGALLWILARPELADLWHWYIGLLSR